MSRQIVITLPEWTEIKGIDNKQFAELLPCYDEMLNMIKNGTSLNEVLDEIKAEISKLKGTFPNEYYLKIIDKYREENK